MASLPEADVDVTVSMVRRLLAEQFPDLALLPLRHASSGWDNVLFRLGDGLAVRLPRREAAARLMLHEQTWLPRLAGSLSVPASVPLRCGTPSSCYPWHWSVVRWFAGTSAAGQPAARRRLAGRSVPRAG